jgi:Gas vesicle synthesis protein GvpL/GvpF
VIYAYGICEATGASSPIDRRGLGGAKLRRVQADGLAAIYSRHRSLRPRPSRELILSHEQVVEAMMARGPVLPLRFGTELERPEHLETALEERREEMLAALERVRGQVELAVRAIPKRPLRRRAGTGEGHGRRYLLARVEEHQRADQVTRDVHTPLARLASQSVLREQVEPPAIMAAAYLVPTDAVPAFRASFRRLAAGNEDLRVALTGPWPPYNFATGDRA